MSRHPQGSPEYLDSVALHQTASQFLAAATLDLFPDTLLLGGGSGVRLFYYDLRVSFPLTQEVLTLLEERMHYLFKNQREISRREMLSSNAAELFKERKQSHIRRLLSALPQTLVPICVIGDFVDYCPHPFAEKISPSSQVKLIAMEELSSQGGVRVIGAMASDKKKLKIFLQNTPLPACFSHIPFAIKQKLVLPIGEGLWAWLPKGECVRQLLIQKWQNALNKLSIQRISSPHNDHYSSREDPFLRSHQDCFLASNYDKLAEIAYLPSEKQPSYQNGLFETKAAFVDRFSLFFKEENFLQTVISSLQFLLEMPRILGFEFYITLGQTTAKGAGKKKREQTFEEALREAELPYSVEKSYRSDSEAWIEIKIADALGRLWSGPFISLPSTPTKHPLLLCSAWGTMERWLGLILEKHEGELPLWLAPEQVRLIALNEKAEAWGADIERILLAKGIRVQRDTQKAQLSERIYKALSEKIPYVVIIGEKEVKQQTLVVRALKTEREEHLDVEALCERITNEASRI